MINAALGFVAVTPWTVGGLPEDDIEDLLALAEKRAWYARVESEKKQRKGKN